MDSFDMKNYYARMRETAAQRVMEAEETPEPPEGQNDPSEEIDMTVDQETPKPPVLLGDGILTQVPAGRQPVKILGVAVHKKQLVYLVQWENDEMSESAATEVYEDGLTDTNTYVIQASAFKAAFPQLVIQLYESKIVKVKSDLTPEQQVEEAERLLAARRQKELKEAEAAEHDPEEDELDDLKDDDAARAILKERKRMDEMFDPTTSTSESDDDDEMDLVLEDVVAADDA